jgi:hypothetical protein
MIFTNLLLIRAFACSCFLAAALLAPTAVLAQNEPNILGLPVVPQPKPGSTPAATAKSNANSPSSAASAPPPPTAPDRSAIAGQLGIQHGIQNGVGRLLFTTQATFTTAGQRSGAIDAAKVVQRDLGKSCGKQCKPEKMAAPEILPSGQLQFALVFSPLHQHLTQDQFLAALQSRPFNLTPEQLKAPVVAPPQVQVQVEQAAPANPSNPAGTASPTTAPASAAK